MNNNQVKQNSKTTNTTNMNSERISLTMAPGGENHRGNQLIGRMPIKGEGFKYSDIEIMGEKIRKSMGDNVEVLNLNTLSDVNVIKELGNEDQARVLILRNWASKDTTKQIYKECVENKWDSKYLDPNKYRTEIKDGKEVRIRGRVMNKLARTNLCYVAGMSQEPEYIEGKGTIIDLNTKSTLNSEVSKLRTTLQTALVEGGSDSKVEINVVEGNRYYDLKKTGIGFHGDTERVVVICLTIGGGGGYPMRFQWFKDGMPIGNSIDLALNDGDVYIMSEKSVGADWKLRSKYTLRHSAGAERYRSLKKWEKRAAKKAEIKDNNKNVIKKVNKKVEINSEAVLKKKEEVALKKKIRKEKALERKKKAEARALKIKEDKEAHPEKYYKKSLKKLSWDDSRTGFYEWLAVQAEHECAPEHDYFKEFQDIWTGKADDYSNKMNIDEWEKHFNLYIGLCKYSEFM
tara:strand:+ start:1127 stop:2503 length:1377 start_codon:yes stop_codon:yes gene_type:complete